MTPQNRKALIAEIESLLAEAWRLHKRLHRNEAGSEIDHDAFIDMAKDAIADDQEWYRAYFNGIVSRFKARTETKG